MANPNLIIRMTSAVLVNHIKTIDSILVANSERRRVLEALPEKGRLPGANHVFFLTGDPHIRHVKITYMQSLAHNFVIHGGKMQKL